MSRACGHLGANAHSLSGASNADSGRPGIAASRSAVCAMSGRAADSAADVRMQRVVVQQRRLADLDDLARVHHRGPVADRGGQLQVVGDEQHRQAELAAQVVQDRHHLGLGGDVERGRRLVGEQQLRLGQQRGGDHDALQHAAGQLVRVLAQPPLPSAIPTWSSISAARRFASAGWTSRLVRSASVMKSPIRRTGFTCARGSWKIIATLFR